MIRTRTVSFPCPEELLPAIDNFKDLGITKSRAETLAMLIELGLKAIRSKMPDLELAAKVFQDKKLDIISDKDRNINSENSAI
jgi:hypothetical protein